MDSPLAPQEDGIVGKIVGRMIRNTVRARFHNAYWIPPTQSIAPPAIFITNHHGWHDGYIMYHVVKKLGLPSLDWIQEFDVFPHFAKVGGLPYPVGNPQIRAKTIRQTIRLMQDQRKSFVMFAEGVLHSPPSILPLGKALKLLAKQVPHATLVPVAIKYELSLHERPEAFVLFGQALPNTPNILTEAHAALTETLFQLNHKVQDRESFDLLAAGTPDVNERWDMRKWRK